MTRETGAAQSTRRTCSSVSLDSIDHNHTTCYVIADKIVSFTGAIEKEIFIFKKLRNVFGTTEGWPLLIYWL